MAGSGGPDALALVWDLPDQGGPSGNGNVKCVGTGHGTRYDAWDYHDLWDADIESKISSVSLFTPINGATVLILYSYGPYPYSYQNATHFDNDFLLVDNQNGGQFDLNLATRPLMDGTWDNAPTSLIVVHTAQGPEIRVSANQTLTPIWNSFIDQQLAAAGGQVIRDGNPEWVWVPFPIGPPPLSPLRTYLRVTQKLTVVPPAPIADYAGSITYYIRLVVQDGTVTGWVARWEHWVEQGIFSDYVGAILHPYTILGAESLNDVLAGGVFPLPPNTRVTDVYYLPGLQTDATSRGEAQIFQGNCTQDTTIVLQTG